MIEVKRYKTRKQTEKDAKDLAIYTTYQNLVEIEGQSKTIANELICKEYGIKSPATLYIIRRRVEERIRKGMI